MFTLLNTLRRINQINLAAIPQQYYLMSKEKTLLEVSGLELCQQDNTSFVFFKDRETKKWKLYIAFDKKLNICFSCENYIHESVLQKFKQITARSNSSDLSILQERIDSIDGTFSSNLNKEITKPEEDVYNLNEELSKEPGITKHIETFIIENYEEAKKEALIARSKKEKKYYPSSAKDNNEITLLRCDRRSAYSLYPTTKTAEEKNNLKQQIKDTLETSRRTLKLNFLRLLSDCFLLAFAYLHSATTFFIQATTLAMCWLLELPCYLTSAILSIGDRLFYWIFGPRAQSILSEILSLTLNIFINIPCLLVSTLLEDISVALSYLAALSMITSSFVFVGILVSSYCVLSTVAFIAITLITCLCFPEVIEHMGNAFKSLFSSNNNGEQDKSPTTKNPSSTEGTPLTPSKIINNGQTPMPVVPATPLNPNNDGTANSPPQSPR